MVGAEEGFARAALPKNVPGGVFFALHNYMATDLQNRLSPLSASMKVVAESPAAAALSTTRDAN